jgi:hypothetical protein
MADFDMTPEQQKLIDAAAEAYEAALVKGAANPYIPALEAALSVARAAIKEECARVAIKEARELEIANATDGDIHSVKIRAGGIMAAKDIAAAIRAME